MIKKTKKTRFSGENAKRLEPAITVLKKEKKMEINPTFSLHLKFLAGSLDLFK